MRRSGHCPVQGMVVMYKSIEERLTAGFAGLKAKLANWKTSTPSGMLPGLGIAANYPAIGAQSTGPYGRHPRQPPSLPPYLDPHGSAGPMPGGPVDMFMAAADPALIKRGQLGPQGMLALARGMRNSGGSDVSGHSQASQSETSDTHSMRNRSSYQDFHDLKHRSA